MDTRIRLAIGLVATAVLAGTVTVAQTSAQTSDCPKVTAVERIDGTVMNVDTELSMVTVLGTDGTTHKFQASQETLQGLKIGDKIEAKLRISEKCRRS
jgi:Cu/Ag efflux protein CusF